MKNKTPDQLRLIHIRKFVKQRIGCAKAEIRSLDRMIKQEAKKSPMVDAPQIVDYNQRKWGYRMEQTALEDVLMQLDVI